MSKLLKSHAVGLPETKDQQRRKYEETCPVYICICNESKKIENVMRKVATSRKSKTHNGTMKNKTHFGLCLIENIKMLSSSLSAKHDHTF